MSVTLVVDSQPDHEPPRNVVSLSTTAAALLDLSVSRDGTALRRQLPEGSATATVEDIECPYGAPVTYRVTGTEVAWSSAYATDWSSLPMWPTAGGWMGVSVIGGPTPTPTVSGGRLATGAVSRYVAGVRRIVVAAGTGPRCSLEYGNLTLDWLRYFKPGSQYGSYRLIVTLGGTSVVLEYAQWLTGHEPEPSFPVTDIRIGSASVTVTLGSNRVTVAGAVSGSTLLCDAGSDGLAPVTCYATTGASFDRTIEAQLDAGSAWLIHPSIPDRSVCIDAGHWRRDGVNVARETAQEVTRRASSLSFYPVGASESVVFRLGPRRRREWSLGLRMERLVDRDAVALLLADGAPLLLLSPSAFGWDLPDGWWAVGDVSEARAFSPLGFEDRLLTLPLAPVRVPVVAAGSSWTWGDVARSYATWGDMARALPTWGDVFVGPAS